MFVRLPVLTTIVLCLFAPSLAFAQGRGGGGGAAPPSPPGPPRFEYVGPTNAGRIAAAAGVVGKPGVYFAGETDAAIAPSNGNRMYALIQTGADGVKGLKSEAQGSLWRSDDGGRVWQNVSWDRRLIGRAGYYIRIRVSPDDPDHVLIANSTLWRSRDGGKIWDSGGGGCGDCHDIWWGHDADDGRALHRDW